MARATARDAPAPPPELVERARAVTERLLRKYRRPRVALEFSNPLELLVATILSAQCTDERVNQVTRTLFRRYRSARAYAEADPAELEELIRPTGYYRQKARTLIACCRALVERFGGKVPDRLEDLTSLPGVGRKTANLVLGSAFGKQAIAVDTHVLRVANRLGLAASRNPDRVEEALMALVPRRRWTAFTLATILHGRETCTARNPRCGECVLHDLCPWPEKTRYAGATARDGGTARRKTAARARR